MKILFLIALLVPFCLFGQRTTKTENVVLITLDGMRWQEVFGGAEARLISGSFVSDSAAIIRDFWADTPEKRRERLMPFFWTVIAKQGQLYGNRDYNNFVNVTNKQWFSYSGYSELLCGFADDERIHSNDKFDNPNKNVLEFVNAQPGFTGKVAAYTSWDVFPYIINTKRSGVYVNAGIMKASGSVTEREKFLNEIMYQVPDPWGEVRLDAFTFHYALEYMEKKSPRVMYIAFGETDEFAHGGKYDLYMNAARYTDGFIKSLWEWCQSNEAYRNKTTFIITCDHGRGSVSKEDWRDHGKETANSDQIWIAMIGPDTKPLGEMKSAMQHYQNQVARTIASLLGLDFNPGPKAGAAIGDSKGK